MVRFDKLYGVELEAIITLVLSNQKARLIEKYWITQTQNLIKWSWFSCFYTHRVDAADLVTYTYTLFEYIHSLHGIKFTV